LGFGPVVHWVSQASFSLCFAVLMAVVWWFYQDSLLEAGRHTSSLTAFYVALISVTCAATSVLYIGDVLMRTQGEQKLILLLPGMPVGNALSRIVAERHLRQAFAAWIMATAWALVLPYPDTAANYVAAFCWGTLTLVPFIVQDWSNVRPLLGPVIAWFALRWLHVPVWLVAVVAAGVCLIVLRMRWGRLAHFAQALPVGRLT
jgi:hypothetical protein